MADRKKDRVEFVELLKPVRHALYSHARWALWDKTLAADVVQDAILVAWRNLFRFEMGTNFRAWIFRILINKIYNYNRRTSRSKECPLADNAFELFEAMERENAWETLLDLPKLLSNMLDGRLVDALEKLPSSEKHCFLLFQLQGFTYKEIATVLDIPLGTVMSNMHRARKNLRERLASLAVERGLVKEAGS